MNRFIAHAPDQWDGDWHVFDTATRDIVACASEEEARGLTEEYNEEPYLFDEQRPNPMAVEVREARRPA